MTARTLASAAAIAIGALTFGGCANDTTSMLTTQAVNPAKTSDAKAEAACATLASQIEVLRKDSAVANLEKAADGKSKTVDVKRASLAKQAELNKANADFVTKCAPAAPKPQTAQAAPAATAQAKTAAAAKATEATPVAAMAATADPKQAATAAAKDAAKAAATDAAKKPVAP